MFPLLIAVIGSLGRRKGRITREPGADIVVIELLVPFDAGEGLLLDGLFGCAHFGGSEVKVKGGALGRPFFHNPVEILYLP